MLTLSTLSRALRKLQDIRAEDPVQEELRGWSWHRPPVKPRAYLDLAISEIAYRFCSTKRDLWLRRAEGVKPIQTDAMKRGLAIHELFHRSAREVSKAIALGNAPWRAYEAAVAMWRRVSRELGLAGDRYAEELYKLMAFAWSSLVAELGSATPLTEYIINGSLIGLSRSLRVDALFPGSIVVELKYGADRGDYEVALAGYAMALESFLEIPVDFGLIIVINGFEAPKLNVKPVYISSALRQRFLEARDEAIDILLSGSPPPRPSQCPQHCPFKDFCR
jgi:CRISPR-associated protein Csa1